MDAWIAAAKRIPLVNAKGAVNRRPNGQSEIVNRKSLYSHSIVPGGFEVMS